MKYRLLVAILALVGQTSAGMAQSPTAKTAPGGAQQGGSAAKPGVTNWTGKPRGQAPGVTRWTTRGPGGKILPPPAPTVPTLVAPSPPAAPQAQAQAPASQAIVVGSGGPYVFKGKGQERFADLFNWRPDSQKAPLTMSITSPFSSGPRLAWVRVFLGNRLLATERDFRGKDTLEIDLSGSVSSGVNQIIVEGSGQPGASLKWTMSSVLVAKVMGVDPDEVVVGDNVTVKGQNFDANPRNNKVFVGKRQVQVQSASATELKIQIPKSFDIDEHLVTAEVNGKKAEGSAKLIVRGIPRLSGKSLDGVPPGYRLVIYGENFSKKLGENQITIGGVSAQVQDGNTTQLGVIVPSEGGNFYAPHAPDQTQEPIEIKLKVGKIECKNSLGIFVGNSVWQNDIRGGADVESVGVDVRRNFPGDPMVYPSNSQSVTNP